MKIRNMTEKDKAQVIEMMRVFYHSPAVHVYEKCGFEELPHQEMVKNGRCKTENKKND